MTLKQLKEAYDALQDQKPVHSPDDDPNYYQYDEAMDDWREAMADLLTEFVEAWRKVSG